jgi:hypothetical protein
MRHKDPLKHCSTDWVSVIASMPPAVRASFDKARTAAAERATRLCAALEKGEGGLTTYDPDFAGWTNGAENNLIALGERLERAEFEARVQRDGAVAAHQSIAQK